MTTVTYTAKTGYKFPESSAYYTTTDGITVARTSDAILTVSGTPSTTSVSITVPDTVASHTHNYTYSSSGATITATCGGSGTCDITEGLTLTISAPTGNLVYDGTTTYPAVLSTGYNTTAFPGTYSISYTKDGSAYSGVPKDAGTYTASVTVGTGDAAKTASVSYAIVKVAATVTKAPTAKTLTYTGSAQALVDAGAATGGEMQYALGTATEATQPYTTSIPTATDAGTYYVWYKVKGDENHNDSKAACVKVTIAAKPHEHTWGEWQVTKKATCVAKGEKKRTCSECKKEETAEIAIDPNNHTGRTEIKGKKDATESAEGYTGDTYCKDCGVKLKSGKAIPKLEKKHEEKTEPQKEEKKPFTDFRTLRLTASKRSKDAITLKWRKYADADGYLVYGCKCGEGSKMKLLKTIKGNKNVTWTHKKLKKGTYYKYKVVVAYKNNKGKKKTLVNSTAVHTTTTGAKRTVSKAVKVNKTKATVKKGKTFQIKASEVKDEKKKKIEHHRDICYESSNKKIATVNEKGKVKGVKKGTATIFVYSESGHYKTVKVTVK